MYGSNLAVATEAPAAPPWPDTLAGTRVRVRNGATLREMDAPLLYASPSQINFQVPVEIGASFGTVSVLTPAGASSDVSANFVAARFSAFTGTHVPFGPAVVQQANAAGIEQNRFLRPAHAGDVLVIWGTGLGGGQRSDVRVWVGQTPLPPFYAGPAPGLPGVDQINVAIPSPDNYCFVPVSVEVAGQPGTVYTIAASSAPGPCPGIFAFGQQALGLLDAGGTVKIVGITIQDPNAEFWAANYDAAHLSLLANYDGEPQGTPVACTTSRYSYSRLGAPPVRLLPSEVYGSIVPLDGVSVSVTGTCPVTFVEGADGIYRASSASGCTPQAYSVHAQDWGSGGLIIPPPAPALVQASFDPVNGTVSWSGNSSSRFTLELSSSFTLPGNIFNGLTDVTQASCRLSGQDGGGEIDAPINLSPGPAQRSVVFRLESATISSGSGDPLQAAVMRVVRTAETAVSLPQ